MKNKLQALKGYNGAFEYSYFLHVKRKTMQFNNVSIIKKANVYFDGKVVSRTIVFEDGSTKTLGFMHVGDYTFNTGKAEIMEFFPTVTPDKIVALTPIQTFFFIKICLEIVDFLSFGFMG